ncbi:MAG TPA: cyclopropane-fatty-acyl-phospholipid synthase family protein [Acidimicrobiia bacterium]
MTPMMACGLWIFRRLAREGALEVEMPTGDRVTIGHGHPIADISIRDLGAILAILREGLNGFAEAYMSGRIDTSDLDRLIAWGLANQKAWFDHPLAVATSPIRRVWQRIRPDRRHSRVRTMNEHYNLGNDFYASWLDPTMTYSSARFQSPEQILEEAQRHKYRTIAEHAQLAPGMRVLEVGCGWGGFAEYAAIEIGCDLVGITLAKEHAGYAEKRIANAGLADRVEIRIEDFRSTTGTFDAVVSIEMIESIDERQWPDLFQTIFARLEPGALAAMQIITIADPYWERYRSRSDFIQQYIFPSGQLPAPKVLRRLSADAGLEVEQIETFGPDYARTLAAWRANFTESWDRIQSEHDLDERFRRMWHLYLTLCEAGFTLGRINVEQWVFRKPAS